MNIDPLELIALIEEDDNQGMCKSCAYIQAGVEPDARNYTCENCGEDSVFGVEELLLEVY